MFGIGSTELFIIAVFALLIFGPDKIPEIARTVSKGMRMFKDAQADMQKVISGEFDLNRPDNGDEGKKAYEAGTSTARQAEASSATSKPQQASTASEIWSDDEDEEGDEE